MIIPIMMSKKILLLLLVFPYRVCATNSLGTSNSTALLKVEGAGSCPMFERGLLDCMWEVGEVVNISVDVIGTPTPTLRWLKVDQ